MAVERTPFAVEDDTDDDDKPRRSRGVFEKREESKPKLKKPEALGILAVEPKPAPEKVLAKKSILAESYEPAPESEAPTESIGKDGARVIIRRMARAERQAARQAAAEKPSTDEVDPKTAAADQAAEHFYDLLEDGEDLQPAFNETLAEMGAEPEEAESPEDEPAGIGEASGNGNDAEEIGEPEASEEEPEVGQPAEADAEELQVDHNPEAGKENESDTGLGHQSGHKPPSTPKPESGPVEDDQPAAQSPGGGSVPPFLPLDRDFGAPQERNPDVPPPTAAEAPAKDESYRQIHPAAAALVGGIIGYLIGRRRGRIKTEKRLLPIQKKLEKEVENLQWEVKRKEAKIRAVAVHRYESGQRKFGPAPRTPEQNQTKTEERLAPILENHETPGETARIPESQHAHEHIGHMLLASQARPEEQRRQAPAEAAGAAPASEKNREADSPAKPENVKRIDTLNRAELMALGEKITIEDSNLRQMYETHLIGERGLRRLVAEHLSGGDLRKALRDEVLERERDFERDPVMRDLPVSGGVQAAAGGTAALDQLLQKAAVSVADSGEEAAFFKARARYEATHQQQQYKQQRRVIDISLVVIITTLLGVVVAMYLTRG